MMTDNAIKQFQSTRSKLELWPGAFQWFNFQEYKSWYERNKWIASRRHKANLVRLRVDIMARLRAKSEVEDEL